VALWYPAVAVTARGADGATGARGVIAVDGLLLGPMPALLTAATVNVYGVPLVRPPTVKLVTLVAFAVFPPGDAVIT
jgi:hypothetical protein